MKYIIMVVLVIALIVSLVVFASSVKNSRYYKYRDLAILSCKGGDMEKAHSYIQVALEYARDPDLINEGLYYKSLFDQEICDAY